MTRWLLHVLGIDDVSGRWYAFWSGVGGDLGFIGAAFTIWRRHSCHVRRCWRVGRQQIDGTTWHVCHRHHPIGAPSRGDLGLTQQEGATPMHPLIKVPAAVGTTVTVALLVCGALASSAVPALVSIGTAAATILTAISQLVTVKRNPTLQLGHRPGRR